MGKHILEMKGITKEFPGVKALDNVTFKVKKGEIHCLIGENGAGKSTLMKTLSGVYPYGSYIGDIIFEDKVQKFNKIKDSENIGIAIIYQELALIPYMSIFENIFLGNEIETNGIIDWNKSIIKSKEALKKVGLEKENPEIQVCHLGVGKKQLVEIAKALSKNVKLLILDEPTAALNEDDSENLLNILRDLRDHGITSILISHKLKEVMSVADSITVLRDGQTITTMDCSKEEVTEEKIVKHMVGRTLDQFFPDRNSNIGEVIMEVKNWSINHHEHTDEPLLKNINFNVRRGEILGLAGLMGAGRTELAMSIFGKSYGSNIKGEISFYGEKVDFKSPKDAIDKGLSYLTEDRKEKGLILIDDIKKNISLANLEHMKKFLSINANEEVLEAEKYKNSMKIKTPSIEETVGNLSGGNQQKVALSKWMLTNPKVLIVDEPTRGIDVGAKYEIYSIMNEFVSQGNSIIMISSELPEILGMSDRVYVMHEGQFVKEFDKKEATQENIMMYATGQQGGEYE